MLKGFSSIPIRGQDVGQLQWELNRTVDALQAALDPVTSVAELDFNALPAVAMPAGATVQVNHGLNRQPLGWALTDVTGGYPQVYRTAWDTRTITFQSLNACTADLKVW